jgi:membrane protein involved in colicin uptake
MRRSTRKSYGGAPASVREVALRQILKRTNLTPQYRKGIQSEYNKLKGARATLINIRSNVESQSNTLSAVGNMFRTANKNAATKNAEAKTAANEAARVAEETARKMEENARAANDVARKAKENANRKIANETAAAAAKATRIKVAAVNLADKAKELVNMIGGTRKRRH